MKIRMRYTKLGKVRFLSHRDVARVWERAIRRAELPIAYSEGFSPRPKLHFGLALSVGHESIAEYIDIDLREAVELDGLCERITAELPDGLEVTAMVLLASTGEESLQAIVDLVIWQFTMPGVSVASAQATLDRLLDQDTLMISVDRKGKLQDLDLRPVVVDGEVGDETPDGVEVRITLSTRPKSVRPGELLAALDPTWAEARVRRLDQLITSLGTTRPPISWADSPRPLALQEVG